MTPEERLNEFKRLVAEAQAKTGITIVAVLQADDLGGGLLVKPILDIRLDPNWKPPEKP